MEELEEAEAAPISERARAVDAARKIWAERLLDPSRRNNLLYFRDLQTGTLDLSAQLAAVRNLFEDRKFDVAAPDRATANSLRTIREKARENLEERGLETLYVAVGMATWPAASQGRDICAPVLLLPVVLEQHGRAAATYSLRAHGDPELNPVLLANLADLGVDVDGEALLSGGAPAATAVSVPGSTSLPFEAILGQLAESAKKVNGFGVTLRAVLGNFSFQKMAILRDINECAALMVENDIVAALAGDPGARSVIASARFAPDPKDFDTLPPALEFTVLDADSSQQRVIMAALAGQSGVVQGPPGTGKSQTIANLIAGLAAGGKRVLFVAEKRAALEAVLKRLQAQGLGDLALDLHGTDISRRLVAQRLQRSLDAVRTAVPVEAVGVFSELADRRLRLVEHVERLHAVREPSARSAFQIESELLGLGAPPAEGLPRWRGADLRRLSADASSEVRRVLADMAPDESLFLRDPRNPWAGAALSDGQAAQRAIDFASLANRAVAQVEADIEALCAATGFPRPASLEEHRTRLSLVDVAAATLAAYDPAVFASDLHALERNLGPARRGPVVALLARWFRGAYRRAVRDGRGLRRAEASPRELAREIGDAAAMLDGWRVLAGPAATPVAIEGAQFRANVEALLSNLVALDPTLARPLRSLTLDSLRPVLAALAGDSLSPVRLPALIAREQAIATAGAEAILQYFREHRTPATAWVSLFQFAWLRACLDDVLANEPALASFDGRNQQRIVDEFAELDRQFIRLNARRVRRAYSSHAIDVMNQYPKQEALVRSEALRRSRHLPVRRLLAEAPEVMTALCPCFMASPLSVSQLIGAERYFDFVIFDEASQVLPEDAVASLMRGTAAIVAGDRHQLPPTQFFASDTGTPDPADPAADPNVVEGFESLLDQMSGFLAPWSLEWHYRSRDESLIAFSNHQIYGGSLVTFPGTGHEDGGVSHLRVGGTPAGRADSVDAEVLRVVDLVIDHARNRPAESLGVIALGIIHARRIDAALRERLQAAPDVDGFFREGGADPFFVKNLERVQGDERDAIILTLGAGQDAAGRVVNTQFGPLNSENGRRRLNVAVTRARKRMTVVSAFSHFDMTPARNNSGTELLRHYLEYVSSGGESLSAGLVSDVPLNAFELDVRDSLEAAGVPLIAQLGTSQYRLDFAAQHPTQPGRFVLAIEADGATYHSAPTARDRDRLRQQHLETLGWKFHRIWSTDWFVRKEDEVARAVAAWRAAVAEVDAGDNATNNAPDPPTSAAAPSPQRDPRPSITAGFAITEYTDHELDAMVRWVQSDGLLRTDEQLIDEVKAALGFSRRGARITTALQRAIGRVRG